MLNKILPPNSPARQKLALMARHLNFALPPKLRKNFTKPTAEGLDAFRDFLVKAYLPSWYTGVDLNGYAESEEGRMDIDNHVFHRLEADRYEFIPWIDSLIPLAGLTVLEIGCGSGSATVAMAEQGAKVVALDVHREALEISKLRAQAHGVTGVSFIEGNAQNLKELIPDANFDLIVLFAVLEHMTFDERKSTLCAAWEILEKGKYVCIIDTPNRLWFFDGHTSRLPFFYWLPDELALEYSERSSRYPFNTRFRHSDSESMLSFAREGRGVSFHEIDLALGDQSNYEVAADFTSFLSRRNPAKALKRLLARDGAREKMLNSYATDRHRVFFRASLDLVIKKL